ncbi:MAG TPA: NAD(+) kinase [Lachnospiraceae bacterium]|nr:NAD(+) kinase [Lachnospiraceae bacterium]
MKNLDFECFYIITNTKKDPEYAFTRKLRDFLLLNGRKCIQVPAESDAKSKRMTEKPNPKKDCLLVIGGDGSVLRAAHQVLGTGIPILGINLGTLGYLAEIEKSNWQEMMTLLLKGQYEIEPRMMLEGRIMERGGITVDDGVVHHALNEVVIVRNSAFRVLNFNVYVDGHLLNNINADGIIVATATGSTAYNMSAGGPLVEPKAQLILLTPICAHTLNTRSVVLSAEDSIVIEMVRTTRNESIMAEAVFDGGSSFSLQYGDRIEIRKSEEISNLVKLSTRSFLSTLHKKLSS